MATITKSPKRITAENSIYKLMDDFDPTKYNSGAYKALFDTMSESEFKAYMKQIESEECYVSFEIDSAKKFLNMEKIFEICNKRGFKTHKYVKYRDNRTKDGTMCSVTPYPVLILYMQVKRLQQMLNKKNSVSGNTDKINPITGTVTGDSKAAGVNDTQTYGLIATGQLNTLKELLGPRADDERSKQQMLHHIEMHGSVKLADLHIVPKNKQSLQTTRVYLRGIGILTKVS